MIFSYQREIQKKFQIYAPLILERNFSFAHDPEIGITFLKGWLIFVNYSALEFAEKYSSHGHRYRFHYMTPKKAMIVRWDNVPHHKEVSNFPHHKHISKGVEPSKDINLIAGLEYIIANLLPSK